MPKDGANATRHVEPLSEQDGFNAVRIEMPFISKNTNASKSTKYLSLPGPGLANAKTKGGSLAIVPKNSGPAKVLPKTTK